MNERWQLYCRFHEDRYGWTRWHMIRDRFKDDTEAFKVLEESRGYAPSIQPKTIIEYDLRKGTA